MHGLLERARGVQRPVDQAGEADRDPVTADRNKDDLAGLSRIEAQRRTRGDQQPPPIRRGPVEAQPRVHLEEVEVGRDVIGTVAELVTATVT